MEIFKDIIGYKGLYQISNLGRVKSLNYRRSGKEKQMKIQINSKGYYFIKISNNGINKKYLIHRLIAIAFIKNPENKPCINHIDGNKQNNNVENLNWCTYSENTLHSYKLGLQRTTINHISKTNPFGKGKFGILHCRARKINQYDLQNNIIKKWDSLSDIGRDLLLKIGNITKVCQGKRKTAGGFIWKYTN